MSVGAVTGAAPASAAPGDPVAVTIVHAIPGATVDVYIDTDLIQDDFTFDGPSNPIEGELAAGDTVRVRIVPGANPEGDFSGALLDEQVTIPDAQGVTLVAAVVGNEDVVLVPFEDVTDPLCTGEGEVIVRNVESGRSYDVFQDGELVSEDLQFGDEDSGSGTVGETTEIALAFTGSGVASAGITESVTFTEGEVTTIYVINGETALVLDATLGSEDCNDPTPTPTAEAGAGDDEPAVAPTSVPAGAEASSSMGMTLGALGLFSVIVLVGFAALRRRS
jgi:hypothetical protein